MARRCDQPHEGAKLEMPEDLQPLKPWLLLSFAGDSRSRTVSRPFKRSSVDSALLDKFRSNLFRKSPGLPHRDL